MPGTIALDQQWNGNVTLQRNINGKVEMRVEGTFTGSPVSIEARIRFPIAGTIFIDWFTLATGPQVDVSQGTFSGRANFPAQTQWMALDVRFNSDPTVTTTSSGYFCTGDIFLLTGQSNMERLTGVRAGATLARVGPQTCYVEDTAEAAALGMSPSGLWQSTLGDGLITLANRITGVTGYPCGFIFLARGGTALVKDSTTDGTIAQYLLSTEGDIANFPAEAYLPACFSQVRNAFKASLVGPDFRGFFDLHGEQDAQSTSIDSYVRGKFSQYLALLSLTSRRAIDSPFFVSPCGKYGANAVGVNRSAQAQMRWAAACPGAIVAADRYDLPRDDSDALLVHLSAAGLKTLGNRLGSDFATWWTNGGAPGSGPIIKSAARAGTIITLSLDLNGHSGVAADNPGSPLTGFQVSTDGFASTIPVVNAALSGSAIVLTLGLPPSGKVQIQYASTVAANDGTDNLVRSTDVIVGEIKGSPLRLTAAPLLTN